MRSSRPVVFAITCVLLPVLITACSSDGGGDAGTREDLARMVFKALMEESADPAGGCLPTASDFEQQIETVRGTGNESDLEKAKKFLSRRGGAEKRAKGSVEEFEHSLPQTRGFLEEAEPPIDWSKAEFGGLAPEHAQSWTERGYAHGNLYFRIKSGDVFYIIKVEEVMKLDGGWVCCDGITTWRSPEGPGVDRLKREEAARIDAIEREKHMAERLTGERLTRIAKALDRFANENQGYPEELGALGPGFKEDDLKDAWGNPFVYKVAPDRQNRTLTSHGPDGVPGTDDDR